MSLRELKIDLEQTRKKLFPPLNAITELKNIIANNLLTPDEADQIAELMTQEQAKLDEVRERMKVLKAAYAGSEADEKINKQIAKDSEYARKVYEADKQIAKDSKYAREVYDEDEYE